MKVIEDTLELECDTWSDPGDYPSGAGGGPLPSYDFIAGVSGTVVIELEPSDVGSNTPEAIQEWVADNPGEIEVSISGLCVKKWAVDKIEGNRAVLSVKEFDADLPEPPEPDYERDYVRDYDRVACGGPGYE